METERTLVERYGRHVYYDPDEREYVALCSELPHLSAFGDSQAEALDQLEVALEAAVDVHQDEGWPVPEPAGPPSVEPLPSGRFVARLPKTLHARLARTARSEGVSLNTLVITLLAAGLASYEATPEARPEQVEAPLGT
jgi:antitoxin HicB